MENELGRVPCRKGLIIVLFGPVCEDVSEGASVNQRRGKDRLRIGVRCLLSVAVSKITEITLRCLNWNQRNGPLKYTKKH